MEKKNIILFSGGKDSAALIVWAEKNLDDFEIVFCDTGNESSITYDYINSVADFLDREVVVLMPERNFLDLAKHKQRFPSTKVRFCTTDLKVKPTIDYILKHNCALVALDRKRCFRQSQGTRPRLEPVV
jgi:3'-phosphoadenosine 5'-phosphosulfate sulfotransferase (PAPS reductase)/FAD synthetase